VPRINHRSEAVVDCPPGPRFTDSTQSSRFRHPLVGIVGGMGPLASAELLATVYGLHGRGISGLEQSAPRIMLWSDPDVRDRTAAISAGQTQAIDRFLATAVGQLVAAGAEVVVIACVTAHDSIVKLPPELAARCVSLVDIVFSELASRPVRHLLLCSSGSRKAGVFTGHERWHELRSRLVVPDETDQATLHRQLYLLKRGADRWPMIGLIRRLLRDYDAPAFVAGCTELHLVTNAIAAAGLSAALPSIDPMTIVADLIRDGALCRQPS
jgi:aspartate racemase